MLIGICFTLQSPFSLTQIRLINYDSGFNLCEGFKSTLLSLLPALSLVKPVLYLSGLTKKVLFQFSQKVKPFNCTATKNLDLFTGSTA